MIRSAQPDDLGAIADLERAAGAAFRELGMVAVDDDELGLDAWPRVAMRRPLAD